MALQAGNIQKLTVIRKTDIAYLLKDEEDNEVFLHVNETDHQVLAPNMVVDAFLYFDAKARLSATLKKPFVTVKRPSILKVISVNPQLGCFMDMGIAKDILLSKDYLPFDLNLWPQENDQLWVKLEAKSRLVAKPLEIEALDSVIGNLQKGDQTTGFIQEIAKIGLFIVTEEGNIVLVKNSNLRGKYRLGQQVTITISYQNQMGYEGTLTDNKEIVRLSDADMILSYLVEHDNKMPYTADSSSEEIQETFGLSRKAFKRALGHLYKERIVDFKEGYTIKIGEKNE